MAPYIVLVVFPHFVFGQHDVDKIYRHYDVSPFNIMSKLLSGQLQYLVDMTVSQLAVSQSENMKLF